MTSHLRASLFASVAWGALLVVSSPPAMAQVAPPAAPCNTVSGASPSATVTCTGNVSAGVKLNYTGTFQTLNVNTLTSAITPASGIDGIFMSRDGRPIVISVDTGALGISVTGTNADGIDARTGGTAAVQVTSTGNITSATGRGINAQTGYARATINSTGTILARSEGIRAYGGFTVTSSGNVTSSNSYGIWAQANNNLSSSITSSGSITSVLGGIRATQFGNANVTVTNTGNITTSGGTALTGDAIRASSSAGLVTVNSSGILTSAKASGITVSNAAGGVVVGNNGAINAYTQGIRASGRGFQITSSGDITSATSYGILANATYRQANTLSNTGNITSVLGGIRAVSSYTGAITLTNRGDIQTTGGTSLNADAIRATSAYGSVIIDSQGTLSSANARGIIGSATFGSSTVSVTNTGAITAGLQGIRTYGAFTVINSGIITSTTSYGILSTASTSTSSSVSNTADINSVLGGIRASNTASGQVSVTNRSAIHTTGGTGSTADAIRASSGSGTVIVDSQGALTSANARGIYAATSNTASVRVTNTGTITSSLEGIRSIGAFTISNSGAITSTTSYGILSTAGASLASTLTNTATIESALGGIRATNTGAGGVSVTNRGTITTTGGTAATADAIRAASGSGTVVVDSQGALTSAKARGIYAKTSTTSSVRVTNTGAITSNLEGIRSIGAFTITNSGAIASAASYGILATAGASLASSLTNTAQIDSALGGIRASNSGTGAVSITNRADIHTTGGTLSNADGIAASSAGAVTIDSSGLVTSLNARGVSASAATAANVITEGAIIAASDAVSATSSGGTATLHNAALLISYSGRGLYALGSTGAVVVQYAGTILAERDGIEAHATAGNVSLDNAAEVTSLAARGLYAKAGGSGRVTLTNEGTIQAAETAIAAVTGSGNIAIDNTGTLISATGAGIDATALAGGTVTVLESGLIGAAGDGVHAAGGAVSVTQLDGEIVSTAGSAIAVSGSGDLAVAVGGLALSMAGHATIAISDGRTNRLVIDASGVVANDGGIDELAVSGGSGDESITNNGVLWGSIDLGTGQNQIFNAAGAVFGMGASVQLGEGGLLSNAGTMSPGGDGVVETVAMTGDLTQLASGTWLVDIDATTDTADVINLTGHATLSGDVVVNANGPLTSSATYVLLHADDGVTHDGLTLVGAPPPTLAKSYALVYPDAYTVALGITVDFALGDIGLNGNQTRLGDDLTAIFETGAGGVAPVTDALLGMTDLGAYKDALNQLLPEPYLHAAMAGVMASADFSETLLGCPRQAQSSSDAESCVWAEAGGSYLARTASYQYLDATETAQRMGGGGETRVAPDFRIGVGARFEQLSQDVYTNATTTGYRGQLGLAATYDPGPLALTAAVSGGHAWLDTERSFAFNGFHGTASGDDDLDLLHGKLRATYQFGPDSAYITPGVDLDASYVRFGDVTERGGNGAALQIEGSEETVFSVTPHVEIGGQWNTAGGLVIRPFLSGGATYYGDTGFATQSQFRDAPAGVADFTTKESLDSLLWDVSAGLDISGGDGSSLRLYYDGSFGDTTNAQGGGLRANVLF